MYLAMNVAILGVVPWREVVASNHIASDLMLAVYGPGGGRAGDVVDRLDRVCLGVCGDARLQPDSVCGGAGRGLFQRRLQSCIPRESFRTDRCS